MEISRGPSPPSSPIHIHDHDRPSSRRRPRPGRASGWPCQNNARPMPMAIPGSVQGHEPPPPLPPPRFLPNLDDPWSFGNPKGGFLKAQPDALSTGSSSRPPSNWTRSSYDEISPDQGDFRRRQSSNSTVMSTASSERRYESRIDEGYYSLSGTNLANAHRLHGERQLHHRGQEKSSQAYDNKLLSKIGKPRTPPATNAFNSAESSPTSTLTFGRQPIPSLRSLSFPNSVSSNYADSPVKKEHLSRYGESPISRPISPSTLPSSTSVKSYTEFSSPTFDESRRSSTLSSDRQSFHSHSHSHSHQQHQHQHQHQRLPLGHTHGHDPGRQAKPARRSLGGSGLSDVDESAVLQNHANLGARAVGVKRESYDVNLTEPTDSSLQDTVQQLHLEDHPTPTSHRDLVYRNPPPSRPLQTSASMSGIKRKQMASPPDASQDAATAQMQMLQQTANSASQYSQNASHLTTNQFGQTHQPLSSPSSSAAFQYASADAGTTLAGTLAVIDQHSPTGMPSSDQPSQFPHQLPSDAQYAHALSLDPAAHGARAGPYPDPVSNVDPYTVDADLPPRKTNENPGRRNNNGNSASTPTLSASSNICQCCPKKPKKFDTPEELRQHESEKRHQCLYCNNRFKNKNEAERHQNSLHLRRHSWSCAGIAANYEAAFFPSLDVAPSATNVNPPQPAPSPTDICGYCGAEFANPPNWDERTNHLDHTHKFRECNQSKKFFRADHFRQHLKHSHEGKSGKWTNRLELACIKDEPPPIPIDHSNSASMPTQSAPVANMGAMPQHNIKQESLAEQSANALHMNSDAMGPAAMHPSHAPLGAASMPQLDMANIDPSISGPQVGGAPLLGNMNTMGPGQ